MLEAKEYENIDLVSPFSGEVVDVCCGKTEEAPVIYVSTQYVDQIQTIWKQNGRPGLIENKLLDLEK